MHKYKEGPIFLDPVELGKSLKEVASEIVETKTHNLISRWFHGGQDVDMFIWTDGEGNIIKQQMNYWGQIIEWNLIEGVRTGFVLEEDKPVEEGRFAEEGKSVEEIICYDEEPHWQAIEQSLEVISHMSVLDDAERQQVLNNFKNSPQLGEMEPEQFLKFFGRASSLGLSKNIFMRFVAFLRRLLY